MYMYMVCSYYVYVHIYMYVVKYETNNKRGYHIIIHNFYILNLMK